MPALRTRDTHARSTLEVSTDAPQPPTLAIISPTPRAFTFPVTHNLSADAHSPFSSPSHSPFEPDLHPLPITTTPPPLLRTLSPDSAYTTPSSIASPTHKRRKSSSASISSAAELERRPKKGDDDYIKRPENAFILFRRKCCEDRQAAYDTSDALSAAADPTSSTSSTTTGDAPAAAAKKQRQADLSKTISQQWKSLPAEERQYWENLAKEKKKEHEQMYPNYVYRPQRARDKDGRSKSRKPAPSKARKGSIAEDEHDAGSLSFVLPTNPALPVAAAPRHHGRSASAPTPPPYQSIQIPNVYQLTPSCPTSPSLLPMISRRAAHPAHPDDDAPNAFDYLPAPNAAEYDYDPFMTQPFAHPGQFEASLHSSEFLRSMFALPAPKDGTASLHPLGQYHAPTGLLPPHHIHPSLTLSAHSPASSISSGPSGPSSPTEHAFPAPSTLLAQSFAQLSTGPDSMHQQHQQQQTPTQQLTQAELDLQMELHQQLQHDYDYASAPAWAWPAVGADGGSAFGFGSFDEFDLGAIPPVELGVVGPKYGESVGGGVGVGSGFGGEFGEGFGEEGGMEMEMEFEAGLGMLGVDMGVGVEGYAGDGRGY